MKRVSLVLENGVGLGWMANGLLVKRAGVWLPNVDAESAHEILMRDVKQIVDDGGALYLRKLARTDYGNHLGKLHDLGIV